MKRDKTKKLEQRLRVVKQVVKTLDPQQLKAVTGGLAAYNCPMYTKIKTSS